MVIQYKLKTGSRWIDYPGKEKFKHKTSECGFRLLDSKKKKILVPKGSYNHVLKRFRQIEFFKHK